jgi:hypothetical protein
MTTKSDLARELDYPIDTLLVEVRKLFGRRVSWEWIRAAEYSRGERASDIAEIHGLILAIRVLRSVRIVGEAQQ